MIGNIFQQSQDKERDYHIRPIRLCVFMSYWFQFSGWWRIDKGLQDKELEHFV
jgi:hypothetical protein